MEYKSLGKLLHINDTQDIKIRWERKMNEWKFISKYDQWNSQRKT